MAAAWLRALTRAVCDPEQNKRIWSENRAKSRGSGGDTLGPVCGISIQAGGTVDYVEGSAKERDLCVSEQSLARAGSG